MHAPSATPGSRFASLAARALRHAGTASALGVRVGAAGLAYLLQIMLARSLGAEQYGVFSFAWSVVTIGGFLATLGTGQIAVRFLAQYHEAGSHSLAQGFIRAGIGATLAGSLGGALVVLALLPLVEAGYGTLSCAVLAIGVVALPFFALTDLMEGIARAQGWTIRALAPPYLVRTGVIILILIGALAAGGTLNAGAAMEAALFATFLAAIVQGALIGPKLRRTLPPARPAYDLPAWRRAAIPTLLADLALLARQNIDLILLGLIAGPASAGIYFAATRIASLLGLIEFAVAAAFGHRFARAAEGAPDELARLHGEARRLTFGPGLAAALVLALGTPLILTLFGRDFGGAIIPTLILIAGAALRLVLGPAEDLIAMGGHPEAVLRANAAGALVIGLGCALLVPGLGATGAALAAFAGTAASMVILARAIRRDLGLAPIARPPGRAEGPR
jgi:O-antigen/teichoic acid export membrane protein